MIRIPVSSTAAELTISTGTEPYSFSRVTTFEQCARRYRYRYLDGVQEGFDSVESFMGRQVHAAIEWLYGERDGGRKPRVDETVARYCASWDAGITAGPRLVRVIKDGTPLEGYRRAGAEMLSRFYQTRFISDRLETVGNEHHFLVTIGERYEFQGYIDRLARDEAGTLHVIDYKTGRKNGKGFTGREAEQLEAYALALFASQPAQEIELVLEYLRIGDRIRKRVRREESAAIESRLVARIEALESSTVFPPNPGILCRWCGYNDVCDAAAAR
jgi:putative RecB family exonuclease